MHGKTHNSREHTTEPGGGAAGSGAGLAALEVVGGATPMASIGMIAMGTAVAMAAASGKEPNNYQK